MDELTERIRKLSPTKQALLLQRLKALDATAAVNSAEQGLITGAVPLLPEQHAFLSQNPVAPHHWNADDLFEVSARLDPRLLEHAVRHLLAHHDALRARFTYDGLRWHQHIAPLEEVIPFADIDLSALPQAQQTAALERMAVSSQISLNLATGPVIRVVRFYLGNEALDRLLFVVHHLVLDNVSAMIVYEDFFTIYRQLENGQVVQLPPKTTSLRQWGDWLVKQARSDSTQRASAYWLSLPWQRINKLPLDYPNAWERNVASSSKSVRVVLTTAETHLLMTHVLNHYSTQLMHILLTALVLSLQNWVPGDYLLIQVLNHGRGTSIDGIDLSRTVGLLTIGIPAVLPIIRDDLPDAVLASVKQHYDNLSARGMEYSMLKYLCDNEQITHAMQHLPRREIFLNYSSASPASSPVTLPVRRALESAGPSEEPQRSRGFLLSYNVRVAEGHLRLGLGFSDGVHRRETIETLANNFMNVIRWFCRSVADPGVGQQPERPAGP